jgi:hypothetical protein
VLSYLDNTPRPSTLSAADLRDQERAWAVGSGDSAGIAAGFASSGSLARTASGLFPHQLRTVKWMEAVETCGRAREAGGRGGVEGVEGASVGGADETGLDGGVGEGGDDYDRSEAYTRPVLFGGRVLHPSGLEHLEGEDPDEVAAALANAPRVVPGEEGEGGGGGGRSGNRRGGRLAITQAIGAALTKALATGEVGGEGGGGGMDGASATGTRGSGTGGGGGGGGGGGIRTGVTGDVPRKGGASGVHYGSSAVPRLPPGGLIAHPVGAGKTIIAAAYIARIAAAASRANDATNGVEALGGTSNSVAARGIPIVGGAGATLVLCPEHIIGQWLAALRAFAPKLRCRRVDRAPAHVDESEQPEPPRQQQQPVGVPESSTVSDCTPIRSLREWDVIVASYDDVPTFIVGGGSSSRRTGGGQDGKGRDGDASG